MGMRSHMNGSVNHFESDSVSAGFARRKNIVEHGNNFMRGYVSEFVIHLVNARTRDVVTWFKYSFQNVALLTERDLKK